MTNDQSPSDFGWRRTWERPVPTSEPDTDSDTESNPAPQSWVPPSDPSPVPAEPEPADLGASSTLSESAPQPLGRVPLPMSEPREDVVLETVTRETAGGWAPPVVERPSTESPTEPVSTPDFRTTTPFVAPDAPTMYQAPPSIGPVPEYEAVVVEHHGGTLVLDPEAEDADPDAPAPPVMEPPVEDDRPRRPLPRVVAIANQKGGVGKTTTTVNLGAALAEDEHRVLVIDLDPQGNATTGLGINSRVLDYSIYDVLLADVPLEDCVESTAVRNLFIAPASLDLAGAEIELVPVMSRELRLRNAIHQVRDDYDYILIDCPPSLGLLTVNALAAADEVMVPIQCEYYALEGLGQLIRNINLVQKNLNTSLELSSIVLVMYDGRTKLAEQVSAEVREHFGSVVCRNVIPRNVRLSEAPSYGQPITTFDPSSRGAVAYRELAREVHRVSS